MKPETAQKSIRPGDVVGLEAGEDVVDYYRVVDVGRRECVVWGPASPAEERDITQFAFSTVDEYIPRERAEDIFRNFFEEFDVDEDRKESSGDVQDDEPTLKEVREAAEEELEAVDVDADEIMAELEAMEEDEE